MVIRGSAFPSSAGWAINDSSSSNSKKTLRWREHGTKISQIQIIISHWSSSCCMGLMTINSSKHFYNIFNSSGTTPSIWHLSVSLHSLVRWELLWVPFSTWRCWGVKRLRNKPRAHGWKVVELEFKPRLAGSRVCAVDHVIASQVIQTSLNSVSLSIK